VLGAALLDARLEAMLRRHLRSFQEELLAADRPLGSFSARIRMASAFALIGDEARADLDTNRFVYVRRSDSSPFRIERHFVDWTHGA